MNEDEHEAGAALDADAQAFLDREAGAQPAEKEAKSDRAKDEPDYDAGEAQAAEQEEERQTASEERARKREEDRALMLGWSPQEEWRGDPSQWVDAKTFLKRTNPAILWERLEKLDKERKRDRESFDQTTSRMERMNEEALKRQQTDFDQRIQSLQKQRDRQVMEVAAEQGVDAAQKHNEEWANYLAEEQKKRPQASEVPANRDLPPEVKAAVDAGSAWIEKHPQFKTNKAALTFAHSVMDEIANDPAFAGKYTEQFAELDRRLAPRFPEIYGGQQKQGGQGAPNAGAPPAESRAMDGVRIAPKKTTNYASRLPASAKAQGERFVRRGDFKDLEHYAKSFFEEDAR